jgi:hypothetical protein
MLKIRLLQNNQVVHTIDAKWTINICELARYADDVQSHYGADDWAIVSESDVAIFTKFRWRRR